MVAVVVIMIGVIVMVVVMIGMIIMAMIVVVIMIGMLIMVVVAMIVIMISVIVVVMVVIMIGMIIMVMIVVVAMIVSMMAVAMIVIMGLPDATDADRQQFQTLSLYQGHVPVRSQAVQRPVQKRLQDFPGPEHNVRRFQSGRVGRSHRISMRRRIARHQQMRLANSGHDRRHQRVHRADRGDHRGAVGRRRRRRQGAGQKGGRQEGAAEADWGA